jgi:hypothetical protein
MNLSTLTNEDIDQIYNSSPRIRLAAAQDKNNNVLLEELLATLPDGLWPYGMPTSINPLVVFIGPSPGGSPNPQQAEINYTPTSGHPHPGLFYEDTRGYWDRTRKLGISLVRGLDPTLGDQEALALIGALNLNIIASSDARGMSKTAYAVWAMKMLCKFQPRFVILAGLKSELQKRKEIGRAFNIESNPIDWNRPDKESQFLSTSFRTRAWYRAGTTFIFLPNHVGRPPMTSSGALEAAALDILKLKL